jgi:hypothetical protein
MSQLENDLSDSLDKLSTFIVLFAFLPVYLITFWSKKRYIDMKNTLYSGEDVIKYLFLHTLGLSIWFTLVFTIIF